VLVRGSVSGRYTLRLGIYLSSLPLPFIDYTPLYNPQPVTERAVQEEIRDYGWQSVGLACFPAVLPVVGEEGAGDGYGGVAEE
jgi:hypothetical protein